MENRKYQGGGVFLRVVALVILGLFLLSYWAKDSYVKARQREKLLLAAENLEATKIKSWQYSQSSDEMTGDISYFATIDSRNLIQLEHPYQGYNQPQLTIRRSKQNGFVVMFSISRGQILCNHCDVQVRFDDLPALRFSGVGSASRETEILFLTPGKEFVDAMKKAQTVKVEVLIYKKGNVVSTFDVGGFKD